MLLRVAFLAVDQWSSARKWQLIAGSLPGLRTNTKTARTAQNDENPGVFSEFLDLCVK